MARQDQEMMLGDLRCEILREVEGEVKKLNLRPDVKQPLEQAVSKLLAKYGCNY